MHEEKVLTLSKDENLALIKDLKIKIIVKFYGKSYFLIFQ